MRNPLKITDLPPHGTEIVGDVLRAEFNQLKNVTLAALAREGMEPLPIIASGRLTVGEHIAGKAGSSREHGYVTFIDIRQIRPETP